MTLSIPQRIVPPFGVVQLRVLSACGCTLLEVIPQRIGAYLLETHREREDLTSRSVHPHALSTLNWTTPKGGTMRCGIRFGSINLHISGTFKWTTPSSLETHCTCYSLEITDPVYTYKLDMDQNENKSIYRKLESLENLKP